MTILSVNLNKIAVLRNSRGGSIPSITQAARVCLDVGCGGLTVHPRPDQRHIRQIDVQALSYMLRTSSSRLAATAHGGLNIEGNPLAAPREGYPGLLALCAEAKPKQVTLVPDNDTQITSNSGFDLQLYGTQLQPLIKEFKALGCRVSIFMNPDSPDIERAAELGADRIEIYTGPYAYAFESGDYMASLTQCANAAKLALAAGLEVNAGHDLNQNNLGVFLRHMPAIAEVSIGHALINEALYSGLAQTVTRYLTIIEYPNDA